MRNPDLVRIAPVPPARAIRGRKDFNLGSELMVGHEVGLITGDPIPSDGLRRRDTFYVIVVKHYFQTDSGNTARRSPQRQLA
jgi:hypothetical protein